MIDIETIEREILDLEKRDTTYTTIERLSWLYTVKDHLIPNVEPKKTSELVGSEFREACSNVPLESLMDILQEHFDSIALLYPKEYNAIIARIVKLKEG